MSAVARRRVQKTTRTGCVEISAYWKHWIHLLPQHGPGLKHTRTITLELWHWEAVYACPKEFLSGLIESDGCRSLNTIKARRLDGTPRQYSYPRYQFTNASADIRNLFTDTCDLLGVGWTQMTERNVAVSRRQDVEFLDTFIGPKS